MDAAFRRTAGSRRVRTIIEHADAAKSFGELKMLKTIRDMLIGAIVAGTVSSAFALVGTAPGTGFQLVDGAWLTGLAGGANQLYAAGLNAPNANSQSTATPIPATTALIEVDSSVANGSLVLPAAVAGSQITVINNTSNALSIYANTRVNQFTGSLDTINQTGSNTTAFAVTASGGALPVAIFTSAKNGLWLTK
jgi:hypothetical protein